MVLMKFKKLCIICSSIIVVIGLFIMIHPVIYAYDSTAEISMGGIQFIKDENISIEKEYLSISSDKVEVTYWFLNSTDKDITTIIVFPIPKYRFMFDSVPPSFSDFSVEVNGSFVKYEKEVKAFLKGKEYTGLLNQLDISIIDFDGFDHEIDDKLFLKKLRTKDYELLTSYGLLDDGFPEWTVSVKYFWQQTFQSNSVTIIKHSYTPWKGYSGGGYSFEVLKEKTGRPLSQETKKWVNENGTINYMNWISYILTTPDYWKGTIKEFSLTIKKDKKQHAILSFEDKFICESSHDIVLNIHDFIPKKDLMVYYLNPPIKEK